MNRTLLSLAALLSVGVLFLTVNILGASTLRGTRLDFTENKLYTLTAGARNIARTVDEPITLTLYYSEKVATDFPHFKSYAQRVEEVLREYERASKGKVIVRILDPEPYSDAEDAAVQSGLAGIPAGPGGQQFYFGLVGENSTDKREKIAFFDPSKEEFLEYDLSRLIYLLSDPQKKTIALMAQLPVEGMRDYPLAQGRDIPAWKFVDVLRDFFEVRTVRPDEPTIPAEARVLVLIHPKTLSEKAQYAIDQFVLRGGRLMVFVDPHCEADVPPGISAMQAMQIPKASNLPKLFEAWGLELVPERFAADKTTAIRLPAGDPSRPELVHNLQYLDLVKPNFSSADSITGTLQKVIAGSPGVLRARSGAATRFDPLIETSADSMLMDVKELQFAPDPKRLLTQFSSGGQTLTLAARITGRVATAFPGGDPAPPAEGVAAAHLTEPSEPVNIIVVADCDMLHDRFWVNEGRVANIVISYQKFADNIDFLMGAVDNLSGSSDLISIRARGKFARPFDRVQKIQQEADRQYHDKEQGLQKKLQEAQSQLSEIMRQQPESGVIMLTPEQQAQIEAFRAQMVDTRKELRKIQYERNKDIERLGTTVKFMNIGLMPLLVGVTAVGLGLYRANRRRAWARGGARS